MSRKKKEKKEISQAWLTTYSDMVTLLLTFFVLLYSFSVIDNSKFKKIAVSLQNALLGGGKQTVFDYNQKTGDVPLIGETIASENQSVMITETEEERIEKSVTAFIEDNSLGEYVSVKTSPRGVLLEFKDKILFDTGKAEIKDEGIPILMKLAELIRRLPNHIVIEGHTDNVPIQTSQYPSNWELSSARAMRILNYMLDNRQLDPNRFSIAAYGEYSPIASNDTVEGRAQNRRVNFLIVSTKEESVKQ